MTWANITKHAENIAWKRISHPSLGNTRLTCSQAAADVNALEVALVAAEAATGQAPTADPTAAAQTSSATLTNVCVSTCRGLCCLRLASRRSDFNHASNSFGPLIIFPTLLSAAWRHAESVHRRPRCCVGAKTRLRRPIPPMILAARVCVYSVYQSSAGIHHGGLV